MAKFNDEKEHYRSLISAFKTLAGFLITAITILVTVSGVLFYNGFQDMRNEAKERQQSLKDDANDMKLELKD